MMLARMQHEQCNRDDEPPLPRADVNSYSLVIYIHLYTHLYSQRDSSRVRGIPRGLPRAHSSLQEGPLRRLCAYRCVCKYIKRLSAAFKSAFSSWRLFRLDLSRETFNRSCAAASPPVLCAPLLLFVRFLFLFRFATLWPFSAKVELARWWMDEVNRCDDWLLSEIPTPVVL